MKVVLVQFRSCINNLFVETLTRLSVLHASPILGTKSDKSAENENEKIFVGKQHEDGWTAGSTFKMLNESEVTLMINEVISEDSKSCHFWSLERIVCDETNFVLSAFKWQFCRDVTFEQSFAVTYLSYCTMNLSSSNSNENKQTAETVCREDDGGSYGTMVP